MLAKMIRTAAVLCMTAPSMVSAWDEQRALGFILENHPVLQSQHEAHAAERMLNRLPVIEAMIGERYQSAANLEAAEADAARVREAASERTTAAETALARATSEQQKAMAERELRTAKKASESGITDADATVKRARMEADYEDYGSRRRYALAELGQLRRRFSEKSARRADEEIKAGEIRQTALGNMAKLRELEAERAAADTRLSFLKSKSGWLQKQVAQGQPENELWENAQRQNAETATLKRVDLLIESQRQQIAHLAGNSWESLYRYLSGAGK
jgi:hypothetical protein